MDYHKFLNDIAEHRRENPIIRLMWMLTNIPEDTIKLLSGTPNQITYPFAKLTFELDSGEKFCVEVTYCISVQCIVYKLLWFFP
jgi:hypothetical protein